MRPRVLVCLSVQQMPGESLAALHDAKSPSAEKPLVEAHTASRAISTLHVCEEQGAYTGMTTWRYSTVYRARRVV